LICIYSYCELCATKTGFRLKEQVQILEKSYHDKEEDGEGFDINLIKSFTKKNFPKTRHKLKAQTSKIVSSFKTSAVSCSFVREFKVPTL
jgi:hypothetical protein